MSRTKQTYRRPTLPLLVKFVFFQKAKKVGQALWVPPSEQDFSRAMLTMMEEWRRAADSGEERTRQICETTSEAGFPLLVGDGSYEYGTPNKRRKARDPFFKWHRLTAEHTVQSLLHDWRDGMIYLRCSSSVRSEAKRSAVVAAIDDDENATDKEGEPQKKIKLDLTVRGNEEGHQDDDDENVV
jgi:hypothetical protein